MSIEQEDIHSMSAEEFGLHIRKLTREARQAQKSEIDYFAINRHFS